MKIPSPIAPLLAVAALVAGCGPAGPPTYPIAGRGTVDGKPLAQADITLFAADNSTSADAGEVKDGAFRFRAKPGAKRVEIVQTTRRPDGSVFNPLPAKYNAQTTLKMDVTPEGPNEFQFDLTSK